MREVQAVIILKAEVGEAEREAPSPVIIQSLGVHL